MVNVRDIVLYGERLETYELDTTITQYVYLFGATKYLITMKRGEIINIFEIK